MQPNGDITCPLCRKHYQVNLFELPKASNIGVLLEIRQSLDANKEEWEENVMPNQREDLDEGFTEYYNENKNAIDSNLSELQKTIDQLETQFKRLETLEENMSQEGEIIKKKINTRADYLTERVAKRKQELTETVDKEIEGKVGSVRQQKKTLRTHTYRLMAVKTQVKKHLNEWDKTEVIANKQKLIDMASDTQTPGLLQNAGKTKSALDITFESKQIADKDIGDITKKTVWQRLAWYSPFTLPKSFKLLGNATLRILLLTITMTMMSFGFFHIPPVVPAKGMLDIIVGLLLIFIFFAICATVVFFSYSFPRLCFYIAALWNILLLLVPILLIPGQPLDTLDMTVWIFFILLFTVGALINRSLF